MGTHGARRSEDGYQDFVDRRVDRLERSIARTDLTVRRLVRYGVSLRSDVRRLDNVMTRVAKAQARTEDNLAEATDKLNALIDSSTRWLADDLAAGRSPAVSMDQKLPRLIE